MNQSQCEDNPFTERITITQGTQDFSPEVHMLAGTLFPLCRPTLGGSTANRYNTPSPQMGPQEPTHKGGSSMTRAI